jgi:hypothetical protein
MSAVGHGDSGGQLDFGTLRIGGSVPFVQKVPVSLSRRGKAFRMLLILHWFMKSGGFHDD